MEATMNKKISSSRNLRHLESFQTRVHSDFGQHLNPLYRTTVFRSILCDGRTWRDPSGSFWVPHFSDLAVIPKGITLNPWRGPYQNPPVIACGLRALPNPHIYIQRALPNSLTHTIQLLILPFSLLQGPYESLCPSLTKIPQHQNTHTFTTALSGALPEPLRFLCSLRMTTSHPMIGPYQTPTNPTKTEQLKKENKQKPGLPSLRGLPYHNPNQLMGERLFIF